MIGRIVVVEKDNYAQWLAAQPQGDGLAKAGEAVFRARGCFVSHAILNSTRLTADSSPVAGCSSAGPVSGPHGDSEE